MAAKTARKKKKLKAFNSATSRLPTNLPGIYTFEALPEDVDPRKANAKTLLRYGIPPKPKGPRAKRAARMWQQLLSRRYRHITPHLSKRPEHRTYPKIRGGTGATDTSPVWSGGVIMNASNMQLVFGQWVIPTVTPPPSAGSADGDWWTLAWVGMDGWGSPDVLQAGTAQHVSRLGGNVSTEYFAWHEWFTQDWIQFDNFDVSPGDTIATLVEFDGTDSSGKQWGRATILNISRGTEVTTEYSAPSTVTFQGNSAEWVMETPQFSGVAAQLPEYGEIVFTNCLACTDTSTFDATAATPVDMKPGSTILSTGALESDWKCTFIT
jgi:hypothetical protein